MWNGVGNLIFAALRLGLHDNRADEQTHSDYEIEDLEGITESREESGRQKSADLSGITGLLTSSRLIA